MDDPERNNQLEGQYANLVERSIDCMVVMQDEKMIFVNAAVVALTGRTRKELLGQSFLMVVPPSKHQEMMDMHRLRVRGGPAPAHYETKILSKDGAIRDVESSAWVVLFNGRPAVMASFRDITDRKQAEASLRESESKFRTLFDNAGGATFVADARTGDILECNHQAETLLGRPREELIGMHQSKLHPAGQENKYRELFQRHVVAGPSANYEGEIQHADGRKIPVLIAAQTFPLAGRDAILGVFLDLTEQKRAEAALAETRRYVDLLLQYSMDGIDVLDMDLATGRRLLMCNDRYVEMSGRSRQELMETENLRDWVRDIPHDDTSQIPPDAVRRCLPHRGLGFWIRPDGKENYYEWTAVPIDAGEDKRIIVGIDRDITERRRIEQALRESEERYRDLFDHAPLCIFEEDFTQDPPAILRVNRQAETTYGWSAEEFLALPVQQVIPAKALQNLRQVARSVKDRKPVSLESVNLRRDGTEFPIRLSATVSPTAGIKRVIVMIEDITERHRARQAVEAAHRNLDAAREHERHHMSRELHDSVGQSLAALKISLQGLRASQDTAPPEDGKLREIDRCRHICDALIQEVRHMSRGLYPPALESLGLAAALRQLAEYFKPSFQASVRCDDKAAGLRLGFEAEIALFRIAQEAFSNAHRHSRAGKVDVEFRRSKRQATLVITDDGVGFDPAQALGQGMGLSTMQERARAIGGRFTVKSRPGRTTIRVAVPLPT